MQSRFVQCSVLPNNDEAKAMENKPSESIGVSILRIGPFHQDSNCAEKLQKAILDHDKVTMQTSTQKHHQPYLLQVSNKYFAANVLLQDILSPEIKGTEDGIILVFDEALSVSTSSTRKPTIASASSSFNAVVSLYEQQEPIHTPGEMLRLCVGIQPADSCSDDSKEHQAEYSRRVLWCLDHGFEYVSADLSAHAIQSGHDERDKEGFARVMEAIYGTMWSSSVLHNPTTNNANLVKTVMQSRQSDQNPPVVENSKVTADETEYKENSLHANDCPDDTFDLAIQEARRIREVSTTADLSNEQRRKRADDAASLVLKMMNEMGMEDEEDET